MRLVVPDDARGVVGVVGPLTGVVADVFADAEEVYRGADDVFVIVALPDGGAGGLTDGVDPFGRIGFEGTDDPASDFGSTRR
jgi:hypothetical protein